MHEKIKNTIGNDPKPGEQEYNQFIVGQPGNPEAERLADRMANEPEGIRNRLNAAVHSVGRVATEAVGSIKRGLVSQPGEKEYSQFIADQPGTPEADKKAKKIARSEKISDTFVKAASATGRLALKATGWDKLVDRNNTLGDSSVESEIFLSSFGSGVITRTSDRIDKPLAEPLAAINEVADRLTDRHVEKLTGPGRHNIHSVGQFGERLDKYDKRWYQRRKDPDLVGDIKRGNIAMFRRPWKIAKDERRSIKEANKSLPPEDRTEVPSRLSTVGTAIKNLAFTYPAFLAARWAPASYLKHNKYNGHVANVRKELARLIASDADVKAFLEVTGERSFSQDESYRPLEIPRSQSINATSKSAAEYTSPSEFVDPKYDRLTATRVELMEAVEKAMERSWLSNRLYGAAERLGIATPYEEIVQREVEYQVELAGLMADFERTPEELAERDRAIDRLRMETKDLRAFGIDEYEALDMDARTYTHVTREWQKALKKAAKDADEEAVRKAKKPEGSAGDTEAELDDDEDEEKTGSKKGKSKRQRGKRGGRDTLTMEEESALAWAEHERTMGTSPRS